jgi:hypothetical protein
MDSTFDRVRIARLIVLVLISHLSCFQIRHELSILKACTHSSFFSVMFYLIAYVILTFAIYLLFRNNSYSFVQCQGLRCAQVHYLYNPCPNDCQICMMLYMFNVYLMTATLQIVAEWYFWYGTLYVLLVISDNISLYHVILTFFIVVCSGNS